MKRTSDAPEGETPVIVAMRRNDRARLHDLLRSSGLGSEGLDAPHVLAVAAMADDEFVACAAVEALGSLGLLRSVAVDETWRGTGLGRRIVRAAEQDARRMGVEKLYLFTESADAFFRAVGYRALPRASAPGPIRGTAQFAWHCPDAAVFMTRTLHPPT